jgi:hypothetical protein
MRWLRFQYGKDITSYGRVYFRLTFWDRYSVYCLLAKRSFGGSKVLPLWVINSKKVRFSITKVDDATLRCIILPFMLYFSQITK